MSAPRRLGEIIPGIVARAVKLSTLQSLLSDLSSAAARKEMIMAARSGEIITDEETTLLIQIYQLETA